MKFISAGNADRISRRDLLTLNLLTLFAAANKINALTNFQLIFCRAPQCVGMKIFSVPISASNDGDKLDDFTAQAKIEQIINDIGE